jgi:hypothetical protein
LSDQRLAQGLAGVSLQIQDEKQDYLLIGRQTSYEPIKSLDTSECEQKLPHQAFDSLPDGLDEFQLLHNTGSGAEPLNHSTQVKATDFNRQMTLLMEQLEASSAKDIPDG